MQGCQCPKGQIFNETTGNCVSLKTCGCMHENKKLNDGDQVKDNCNTWYVMFSFPPFFNEAHQRKNLSLYYNVFPNSLRQFSKVFYLRMG